MASNGSGVGVKVTIDATFGKKKLAKLRAAVAPDVILSVCAARLLSFVDRQFKTGGEGKWPRLAATTILLRPRGGNQPLQNTGRYRQSIVASDGGPGKDFKTDKRTFFEIGSNLRTPDGRASLAAVHEYGSGPYPIRIRRAKVLAAQIPGGGWLFFGKEVMHTTPARPVLPAKAVAERLVTETLNAMLDRVAKEA